jgi:hypothetical protein
MSNNLGFGFCGICFDFVFKFYKIVKKSYSLDLFATDEELYVCENCYKPHKKAQPRKVGLVKSNT